MSVSLLGNLNEIEYSGKSYRYCAEDLFYILPSGTTIDTSQPQDSHKNSGILKHNARLGGGVIMGVDKMPGGRNFRAGRRAEIALEDIRRRRFPEKPSRLASYFLSLDLQEAERRLPYWWTASQEREIVRCNIIIDNAKIHFGDYTYFDDFMSYEREDSALRYWNGEMRDKSNIEVVVQGALYFPDWRDFPLLTDPNHPQFNAFMSSLIRNA